MNDNKISFEKRLKGIRNIPRSYLTKRDAENILIYR